MEQEVKNEKRSSLRFHQYARPISDYFLSKAKKESKHPCKLSQDSLYQDALDRKSRQELLIKAADDSAKQSANTLKLTKKSQKLFEYKRIKEIENVILQHEHPKGFISKINLPLILESLSMTLPDNYTFKTLKAKVQNTIQEQALLTLLWSFLSPPDDDFIIKEVMYDLLSILMDKNCDLSIRVEDLKRLKNCIEAVNESSPSSKDICLKIVKEFDLLMDRRKVLGFHRQKEKLKCEVLDFSFQPEINQGKGNELVGLERCEALYRDYQEKEDKILCGKLVQLEKEFNECTFTPSIISGRYSGYQVKTVKGVDKKPCWKERQEEMDLKECTFKPNILKEPKQRDCEKPRGYEKFVGQLRKAQYEKIIKAEREKIPNGENYEKMKNLKSCPPSFLSREKEQKNIIMYIDVNLGLGKKGKVALRAGDDPRVVAENFCKIYQLGKDYEISLEEEIQEQLRDIQTSLE